MASRRITKAQALRSLEAVRKYYHDFSNSLGTVPTLHDIDGCYCIVWESGPDEWAICCPASLPKGVWGEAKYSCVLNLYPA